MAKNKIIQCIVLGKTWELTEEEFEFVKTMFGEPQTVYVWGELEIKINKNKNEKNR